MATPETCESCKFASPCRASKMGGFWCHVYKTWTYSGKWCADYKKSKRVIDQAGY